MASILLATVGTTGDIEPYIHLARALLARGHRVRIASHGLHAERFRGFDFVPAAADFSIDELNRTLDRIAERTEPIEQLERLVLELLLTDPKAQRDRYAKAVEGVDVAVCHRFDYVAQGVAGAAGIPWASVALMPEVFRTEEAPPFPFPRLGRWFARKAWDAAHDRAASMNRRVEAALAPIGARSITGIAGTESPFLDLLAASPALIPVRSDWPATLRVTGAWTADLGLERHVASEIDGPAERVAYTPDPELGSFLDRMGAPVVVTFGSMGGSAGEATSRIIAAALERIPYPAVVQSGYHGLMGLRSDRILTVGYVPHDFLFARARCVVHHSGAGTSTAAARAGAPSVPIPHMFDQYYWAGTLHRAGISPKPVFRRQLTAKLLAQRIEEVVASRSMKERAERLSAEMMREDGARSAAEAVEALIRR